MNVFMIRLLARRPKKKHSRLLIIYTECWWQGYDGDLIMVTEDSWHVLWKRNRPKRMRKAK